MHIVHLFEKTPKSLQGRCKPAEAPPVGFALVRHDSANHASMLALAALSVLARFRVQRYKKSSKLRLLITLKMWKNIVLSHFCLKTLYRDIFKSFTDFFQNEDFCGKMLLFRK